MIEEIKVFQAVCDRCGYVCDEDEGEIEIRDTPDETKHEAENYGWEESMAASSARNAWRNAATTTHRPTNLQRKQEVLIKYSHNFKV